MMENATYLTPPPLFAIPEMHLLGMGIHETNAAGIIHRPLGTEGILITLFHTDALVRLQGIERQVSPSTLVVWEPGRRQFYGNNHGGWDHSWLHCKGSWIAEQINIAHIPVGTLLPIDETVESDLFFQEMRQECSSHTTPDPDIVKHLITLWCLQLQRTLFHQQTDHRIPSTWLALKQYLDAHFAEPITLEMLTERMSLSQQHFSRLFKHYFHLTPMEYLKRLRLEHARFLLSNHNLSIADIARRVGYESQSYFTVLFSAYFGTTPRGMRKGMSGEAARQRMVEERRSTEFARWTREGWTLLREMDYTKPASVDADWQVTYYHESGPDALLPYPAPELAESGDGALRLHVRSTTDWTALRYRQEVDEETKVVVQIRNTPPDGPNLAIAISGDLQTGYRLRIRGYDLLDFETILHGYWEVLHRCQVTLDPNADSYTFVLWRADNVFYAEVDGERMMAYDEPFAAQGPAHRAFALGRYGFSGEAHIQSLHLWARRTPRYVDILEPGRVLLRQGHREDALRWFRRIAEEHNEASIQHEAAYLVALATLETDGTNGDTALQQVAADSSNPFRSRALREIALQRMRRHDFAGAVESALCLQPLAPDAGLIQHIAQRIVAHLRTVDPPQQQPVMTQLARLPITILDLYEIPLASLNGLGNLHLSQLACSPGDIEDLSPLAGMPLTGFTCNHNRLSDLTPLTGMPLTVCSLAHNAITDLSPLANMPLALLDCADNGIHDLSPLAGTSVEVLNCSGNRIDTLAPLRTLPLKKLFCANNQLHDVQALSASPLEYLDCSFNPIDNLSSLPAETLRDLTCTAIRLTDLRDIAHLPLSSLVCGQNAITDLTPLASMPLTAMKCDGNPITDLTPITHLPLSTLHIGTIPLGGANGEVIMALPLRELGCDYLHVDAIACIQAHPTVQSVNGHIRAHALMIAPTLTAALDAWRKDPHVRLRDRYALRAFATPAGDRAYLSLPLILPRDVAMAFCRWQGGNLVSPATEQHHAALMQYLATVVNSESPICHYLGITINADNRTLRWQSGAPYAWHRWQQPEERLFENRQGFPTFFSNRTNKTWWETEWPLLHPVYTIIEWEA